MPSLTKRAFLLILGSFTAFQGCSPHFLFDHEKSLSLAQPSYRKVNGACGGMDLSSSTLNAETFRSVIGCFNANRTIEPLKKLIDRVDDQKLEPLLRWMNEHLLNDKKKLFQIERTYQALVQKKIAESAFKQIGKILRNPELVKSSIALFREGFFESEGKIDSDALKLMELLGKSRSDDLFLRTTEFLLSMIQHPAFQGSQTDFSSEAISEGLYHFASSAPTLIPLLKESPFFWKVLGKTPESRGGISFEAFTSQNASFLQRLFQSENGQSDFDQLIQVLRDLRNQPIICLKGAKQIPDAASYFMMELSQASSPTEFVLRKAPLLLASLGAVCEFPKALEKSYPFFRTQAELGQMDPMARLIRSLSDRPEVLNAFLEVLGETPSKGEPCRGASCLSPLLQKISKGDLWRSTLLVATSLSPQNEKVLEGALAWMATSREELQGRTPLQWLTRSIERQNKSDFTLFVRSVTELLSQDGGHFLESILLGMRNAYLVNEVHPFLDLLQGAFADATHHQDLFHLIFELSGTPEFNDTLLWVAKIAESGVLQDLIESSIQLFHKFALMAESSIEESKVSARTPEPFHPVYFHNLIPTDLPNNEAGSLLFGKTQALESCEALSFQISFLETTDPRFEKQLELFGRCLNGSGSFPELENLFTTSPTLFRSQMEFFGEFWSGSHALDSDDWKRVIDGYLTSMDRNEFYPLLGAVSLFLETPSRSSVVLPFMQLGGQLSETKPEWSSFSNETARFLRSRPILPWVSDVYQSFLAGKDQFSHAGSPLTSDPDSLFEERLSKMQKWMRRGGLFDRVKAWVRAKECATVDVSSERAVEERAKEIIEEPFQAITNWDLTPSSEKKTVRKEWAWNDFKKHARGIVALLEKQEVTDAFLNFTQYFSGTRDGKRAHYTPEYLMQWLKSGSTDYQLITYYYPNEPTPRVRLVNTLDRFELTMLNVDFTMPVPPKKNMALEFFHEIAEAWGDLDPSQWPEPIQEKYRKKRPATLHEAVEKIIFRPNFTENLEFLSSLLGLPQLPSCHRNLPGEPEDPQKKGTLGWLKKDLVGDYRRRLYNIKQVNSVLLENASRRGSVPAKLEVFRDLFYELSFSNTQKVKSSWFPSSKGDQNNLQVVLLFSRLGILRQMGRLVQEIEDPSVSNHLLEAVVDMSEVSEARMLLNTMTRGSDKSILFGLVKTLFDQSGTEEQGALKTLGAYFLPALKKWNASPQFLFPELSRFLNQTLQEHPWLGRSDFLVKLLATRKASDVLVSLYHDPDEDRQMRLGQEVKGVLVDGQPVVQSVLRLIQAQSDPEKLKRAFLQGSEALQEIWQSPEFEKIHGKETLQRFLESLKGNETRALGVQLQEVLASAVEKDLLTPLFQRASNDPEEMQKLLGSLAQGLGREGEGPLKEFFEILRRSLSAHP